MIKQLSVFLENRKGSLTEALEILGNHDVDIVALSLADTSDFGVLRMIVSDPEKGRSVLKENGFIAQLTNVIAIRVAHDTGSLAKVIRPIADAVNIEYMYAFANGEDASAVMKISDVKTAEAIMKEKNIRSWSEEEAYQLNRMR